MEKYYLGLDIGGTKCSAVLASIKKGTNCITIVSRFEIPTADYSYLDTINLLLNHCIMMQEMNNVKAISLGISCGGPLDVDKGLILSPPNLVGWEKVPIVQLCKDRLSIPVYLQNDANAGAMAEFLFGAGQGCQNMIFLTFGTGLGAGLILNGRLYTGASNMAGEIGHVRLTEDGPEGYGKKGSVEGYCSGSGIAKLGRIMREKSNEKTDLAQIKTLSAKNIAHAAENGDPLSIAIYKESGKRLGQTLSILIDILNPEKIIIGGVFVKSRNLFISVMEEVIKQEALDCSASHCQIVPARLGNQIGDYASIAIAIKGEFDGV
ncbi:MAG: ROK family protein [Sphaerochaetaceae bacterium]|nr:ROK family protein [Sphaerochaetaceae bacterium]